MRQRDFQMIKTNGITLRIVVEAKGPLVMLAQLAAVLVFMAPSD
jgi:hypothetical protein